jgi:hypothetical protein
MRCNSFQLVLGCCSSLLLASAASAYSILPGEGALMGEAAGRTKAEVGVKGLLLDAGTLSGVDAAPSVAKSRVVAKMDSSAGALERALTGSRSDQQLPLGLDAGTGILPFLINPNSAPIPDSITLPIFVDCDPPGPTLPNISPQVVVVPLPAAAAGASAMFVALGIYGGRRRRPSC